MEQFALIHVDIVRSLPPSRQKEFCIMVVEQTSGWPETLPTSRIMAMAEAVAKLFVANGLA